MSKEVFVFSTHLINKEGYLFDSSKDRCNSHDFALSDDDYLILCKRLRDANILEQHKSSFTFEKENEDQFDIQLGQLSDNFFNSFIRDNNDNKEVIKRLAKENNVSSFECWQLINGENPLDVYAVKELSSDSPNQNTRIKDLVEQFKNGLTKTDNLYLILHDGDVGAKCDMELIEPDSNSLYDYQIQDNDPNIKLVLFSHTINWVVDVLNSADVADAEAKMKGFFDNSSHISSILANPQKDNSEVFKELKPNADVDALILKHNQQFNFADEIKGPDEIKDPDESEFYLYEDKGLILNELMRRGASWSSGNEAVNPIKNLIGEMKKKIDNKGMKPFIIRVYSSFFNDWEKSVNDEDEKRIIEKHPNKLALEKNLESVYSFFNNSSIWIRIVDFNDSQYQQAIRDFSYFKSIGLYDYASAKESFDYNMRILTQNYLEDKSGDNNGHGRLVIPTLYGNEAKYNKTLQNNCFDNNKKFTYKFFKEFHDVALRILVVDDRVGGSKIKDHGTFCKERKDIDLNTPIRIYNCKDCSACSATFQCKLKTLKYLMDDGAHHSEKKGVFTEIGGTNDYFYWQEKGVTTYFCPDLMCDFIGDEGKAAGLEKYEEIKVLDVLSTDKDYDKNVLKIHVQDGDKPDEKPGFIDLDNTKVQLVGVRDVRTALLLLSRYKFDMIFFDYLLDKKPQKSNERDFAIPFFTFLTGKKEITSLEKFRRDVLDNRGPLDRFWIMPITGFNETFIDHLSQEEIPLIGNKWHINNGADPITTPWQFLDKLNRFIELQLTGSLYVPEKLLRFLRYTGEDLDEKFKNKGKKNIGFEDFQAFLAAEYSSFFSHYGSKPVIKRDAVTLNRNEEENCASKSMFATYIWNKFYSGKGVEDNNKLLFGLHNRMQEFYQVASIMRDDHHGRLMLRESFRRLRYFIDVNRIVDLIDKTSNEEDKEKIKEDKEKIKVAIDTIADYIDIIDNK